MDDFGNDYQTMDWFMNCEQYMYSMTTFGMMDQVNMDWHFAHSMDYAASDI